MNTRKTIGTLALSLILFLGTGSAHSQNTAPGTNPLDPIAWLVGGTWVTTTKASDGSLVTIEVTFEWASHKKLIKYTIINPNYGGKAVPTHEGICGWHPGKKQLVLWETDNDGNLTEAVLIAQGNKLLLEELFYRADGTTRPQRVEVVRESADEFTFKAWVPKEGEWVEAVRFKYKHVKNESRGQPEKEAL